MTDPRGGPGPLRLRDFPPARTLAHTMLGEAWIEHLAADLTQWLAEIDEAARLAEVGWLARPELSTRIDADGRLTAQQLALELAVALVDRQGDEHRLRIRMGYRGSGLAASQPRVEWQVEVRSDSLTRASTSP